jgi:hypothetical protein
VEGIKNKLLDVNPARAKCLKLVVMLLKVQFINKKPQARLPAFVVTTPTQTLEGHFIERKLITLDH